MSNIASHSHLSTWIIDHFPADDIADLNVVNESYELTPQEDEQIQESVDESDIGLIF